MLLVHCSLGELHGRFPLNSKVNFLEPIPSPLCVKPSVPWFPTRCFVRNQRAAPAGNDSSAPLMTFWAFLSQVLSPNSACRDAVRKAQAWWSLRHKIEISSDTSAYCQARARLPDSILERIHRHVSDRMEANVPSNSLWRGRPVKVVDGAGLSMPDTASNQAAYP